MTGRGGGRLHTLQCLLIDTRCHHQWRGTLRRGEEEGEGKRRKRGGRGREREGNIPCTHAYHSLRAMYVHVVYLLYREISDNAPTVCYSVPSQIPQYKQLSHTYMHTTPPHPFAAKWFQELNMSGHSVLTHSTLAHTCSSLLHTWLMVIRTSNLSTQIRTRSTAQWPHNSS